MRFRPGPSDNSNERGASLVEFALVLPLLVILVFGIIEFGWAFAQVNDVRHGAREGARLAAVEDTWNVATIGTEVCDRMDIGGSPAMSVTLAQVSGAGDRGSTARVTVTQTYSTLTGIFDGLLSGKALTSEIEFRLEQPTSGAAAWWSSPGTYNC